MKKILSFVLVLALLSGLSVTFASAEESTDYIFIPAEEGVPGVETYGFKNSEYWDNVYVYATGGRSEYEGGMTYPGEKLEREYVDGYGFLYTFSFAVGYYDKLLFHDGTKNNYRAELEEEFYGYCVEKLGEDSLYEGAKVSITDTMKTYDGTVLFTATSWEEPLDAPCNEMIGHYCVHRSATYSPYGLGVYVSTNDEIYTLEEALEEEVLRGIYGDTGFKGFEFHSVYEEDMDLELMHRCLYAFGDRFGYNPDEGESIYCEPYGYVGEYVVFHAYFSHYAYPQVIAKEQIGDYYFYNGDPCGIGENNSVALYVMNPEGEVFTLYEAYTQGLITDLDAVVELTGGISIFGDWGKRILELLEIDITADSWSHLYKEFDAYYEGYTWYDEPEDGTLPDFVTVLAAESTVDEAPSVKRMGEYAVYSAHTYAPYDLGYYVYFPKEDKVYDFEKAFELYPQYREKILRSLDSTESGHFCLIGNVVGDNKINIKDATYIQKSLAGFEQLRYHNDELAFEASDFNGDGEVNIKDATAIQKFIAGLDY